MPVTVSDAVSEGVTEIDELVDPDSDVAGDGDTVTESVWEPDTDPLRVTLIDAKDDGDKDTEGDSVGVTWAETVSDVLGDAV